MWMVAGLNRAEYWQVAENGECGKRKIDADCCTAIE
jgi:hypothetical protein